MSGRLVRGWMMAAVLAWSSAAAALPLQEITALARGRVVHLSVRDDAGKEDGSGSGFVIAGDGRVATNYHVVRGARRIVAVFPDEREVEVTGTWGFDDKADLAIIQLEPGSYSALSLATTPAREGEDIVLIGSPLGLGNTVTTGIVAAVREQGVHSGRFTDEDLRSWGLQITAAAAPGSSGSPILRTDGEVVGVMVGSLTRMEGAHFGIPVALLRRLSAASSKQLRPLNDATGVRSRRTNLYISGGLFAFVAVVWVLVAKLQRRPPARDR